MDQLRQLDYDRGYDRPPGRDTSGIHGGPACNFFSEARKIGSRISISTSEGAERWLTDSARTATNRATHISVDGFPGLRLVNIHVTDQCDVLVDTADNQYVAVLSIPGASDTPNTPDIYCAEAQRVAEMAVRTFRSSR